MNPQEKEQAIKYTIAKLAEAPQLVKTHLKEAGESLKYRRAYFRIKKYADSFLAGEKSGNIANRLVILPGLRGVGKTTLLFQIYEHLRARKGIGQDRILYFSADEMKAYLGKSILDIVTAFIEDIHKTTPAYLDKELFLLIDEAQKLSDGALELLQEGQQKKACSL